VNTLNQRRFVFLPIYKFKPNPNYAINIARVALWQHGAKFLFE